MVDIQIIQLMLKFKIYNKKSVDIGRIYASWLEQ